MWALLGALLIGALLLALLLDERLLGRATGLLLRVSSAGVKRCQLQALSLLGARARGMHLRFSSEGDDIEVHMQTMQLQLRMLEWIATGFSDKPIFLEMHGLRVNARMLDLVSDKDEPPEKAQAFRTKMLWLSRLCSFRIEDMEVTLDLLDLKSRVRVTTEEMLVRGHQCVQTLNRCGFDVKSSPMEIRLWDGLTDAEEPAMRVRLQAFLLKFDLGLHSKEMFFTIPGCQQAAARADVRKMLSVYERLTELDDVAFETLRRTGFPSKVLALHFNFIDLGLELQMDNMSSELSATLPHCAIENIIKAGGQEKSMKTDVTSSALQLGLRQAAEQSNDEPLLSIEDFQMHRHQTTPFQQGPPADEEIQVSGSTLQASSDSLEFEWVLFLGILSKLLPVPRHAPPKRSTINVAFDAVSCDCAAFQQGDDGLCTAAKARQLKVVMNETPERAGSALQLSAEEFVWSANANPAAVACAYPTVETANLDALRFGPCVLDASSLLLNLTLADDTELEELRVSKLSARPQGDAHGALPFLDARDVRYRKSPVVQVPTTVAIEAVDMVTCSQSALQFMHFIKLSSKFGDHVTAERASVMARFGLEPPTSTARDKAESSDTASLETLFTIDAGRIRYAASDRAELDWSLEKFSLVQSKQSVNLSLQHSCVGVNETIAPLLELDAVRGSIDYEQNLDVWKLQFGQLLLHPCTSMGLGVVVEAMLSQKAALMLAFSGTEKVARVPSVMRLDCSELVMMFAAYLGQEHVSDLTTMRLHDLVWNVDSRASDAVMIEDIRTYDNTSEVISYEAIQGGLVEAHAASVTIETHGVKEPAMKLDGFTTNGRLYMAQASDARIVRTRTLTPLFCRSTSKEDSFLRVPLEISPAPVKMYGAANFGAARTSFVYNQAVQEAFTYASYCSALIVPESPDKSPPLATWDQFRFWTHGNFNIELRSVHVQCTLEDEHLEQAFSQFGFDSLAFNFSRNHFQLDATNATACTPAGTAAEHRDEDSLQTPNHIMHQWMMIPQLSLVCNHVWSSESCHHVYLSPQPEHDAFERFRAIGVHWDIRLRTGESDGERALVALRLDLISQLLAIISNPTTFELDLHESVPQIAPPPTTLQSITTALSFAAELHRLKMFIWCDKDDHTAMLGGSEVIEINVGLTIPATVENLLQPRTTDTELVLDDTSITLTKMITSLDDISEWYTMTVLQVDDWRYMLPTLWAHCVKNKRSTNTLARADRMQITYEFGDRGRARAHSDIDDGVLVDPDVPEDFHPTLTNFVLNHQTFKPPPQCLPPSERTNRFTTSPPRLSSSKARASPRIAAEAQPTPKQWNVLVHGFKMLWTINLRDRLYHIMGVAADAAKPITRLKPSPDVPSPESPAESLGPPVIVRKESSSVDTLMDYLSRQDSAFAATAQAQSGESKPFGGLRRRTVVEMDMSKRVRSRAPSSDASRPSSARLNSASTADDDAPPEPLQQLLVFNVQFVQPQINCLCEKSHCCLLIVAEDWLVCGYRNSQALLFLDDPTPQIKHEMTMQMDKIVVYTAPSDMYGLDIAVWKDKGTTAVTSENLDSNFDSTPPPLVGTPLERVDSTAPGASSYLRRVIPEFCLTSSYTYFSPEEVHDKGKLTRMAAENEAKICQLFLDLPNFELHLDSAQFFVFLNVLRNVLLAPPPVTEAALQKRQEETMQLECDSKMLSDLDLGSKNTRGDVREVLEHSLENKPRETIISTEMQYFISKGSWILHGATETERIEITFNGLHGRHIFSVDGSSDTIMELQRAWIRNLRPGADEANVFEDATSILTPIVHEQTGCARCGKHFIPDENSADACRFHAFADGRHGEFTCTSTGSQQYAWTCCGQRWEGAPGCSARPHVFSEHMLTVRAEAYPMATLRNVELSVFHHLEISFFPGVAYTLELQVSRAVADMLNRYFKLTGTAASNQQENSSSSSDTLLGHSSSGSGSGFTAALGTGGSGAGSGSGSGSGSFGTKNSIFGFQRRGSDAMVPPPPPPESPLMSPMTPSSVRSDVGDLDAHREGVYMRHMRLGEINVHVSTVGFAINLENYVAAVPAFVRQRKLSTWPRFISKIEYHATWSLTKSTATSGLAKIKERFGLKGSRKVPTHRRGDSDDSSVDASKASLLLGGKRLGR